MIKFLVILLFFFSGLAVADPVTVTHMAGKTSTWETEMTTQAKKLVEKGLQVNYVATGQCVDAAKLWNTGGLTPTIMYYSSSFDRMEVTNGKPCTANFAGARIAMVRKSPAWFCSGAESKPLDTPGLKVGTQTVQPGIDLVDDINKSNKYTWKNIPISAAGEGVIALANGDLDYYLITRTGVGDKVAKGQMKCIGSTNRDDTIPYLGDVVKVHGDLYSSLTVMQMIMTKNLTEAQFQIVKDTFDPNKNEDWKKYLAFQDTTVEKLDTDNQKTIDKFIAHAKKSREFYKK